VSNKPVIAVLYHIFYEDSCDLVCRELQPLRIYEPVFLFNICADTPDKITMFKMLKRFFPGCFIITTSNKGKDIGAKLALFQLLLILEIQANYLLLLHDKKSLQALKSSTWKKDLLHILSPESIKTVINLFEKNENCGIIATKNYIIDELFENDQFINVNGKILEKLIKNYDLKIKSFAFVAGTMFWARALPLRNFFSGNNPLEIRKELETGNVIDNFSGTVTHSWERILSWIITSNGYKIEGI
jgi:lipopolysaccharide biosynthesis protein